MHTWLIFCLYCEFSDAIRWTKKPNTPIILVKGVNNTDVRLVWEFVLDLGEALLTVNFQRQRPGAKITTLASRLGNSAFTVFPPYQQMYIATLPSTLRLRNVTKNEYIYSITVVYNRNNIVFTFRDQVKIIVYGK